MNESDNPFEQIYNEEHSKESIPEQNKPRRGRPPLSDVKKAKASREQKPAVGETRRKPVGLRKPAQTKQRKGYVRRWVNDIEDRVQLFKEGSYTHVLEDDGQPKKRRAGQGKVQYLMEIDENLYNGDQQTKYKTWNKDLEEKLKPKDGFYKPKTR